MLKLLKASRERFLDRHYRADDWRNFLFSASMLTYYKNTRHIIEKYAKGRVLDAGAGRGSWEKIINQNCSTRDSIDIAKRSDDSVLTWLGDITCMPQVPNDIYDVVICNQVLEHVKEPRAALEEFHRVLKKDGLILVSVPQTSRLHELPHDYYRFTQNGLNYTCEVSGFQVVATGHYGGLFSFLHHQFSSLILTALTPVPIVRTVVILGNAIFSFLFSWLDKLIDKHGYFASSVWIAARASYDRDEE